MNIVPNQWRVLTCYVDGQPSGEFYVFRNPPNAAFANDERGNRRKFTSHDAAQIVADRCGGSCW